MNGNGPTRIEQFNQAIRGIVVLAFTGAICYGFVVSKVISTETVVVIASVVYTWWFKSRDDEKKDAAAKAAAVSPTPSSGVKP